MREFLSFLYIKREPMPKKKGESRIQLSMLDDLEEIPRTKNEVLERKKKRKTASSSGSGRDKGERRSAKKPEPKKSSSSKTTKATTTKKRKTPKGGRDVRLSTTDPKANRNIIEREYKGFKIWISDKEGRDANKTMATIEGMLGKYVFRTYLRLDGSNDTKGVAKAVRAVIDRIIPDKKQKRT